DDPGGDFRARALPGDTVGELLGAHETLLHQQGGQARQPVFVVAVAKIIDRMLALAGVAGLVEVPLPEEARGQGQRERAPLPLVVEYRLVGLVLGENGPEAVHAAEIVGAIHSALPGARTSSTPIMALRVTSSTRSSSAMPSVPAGLCGSTR